MAINLLERWNITKPPAHFPCDSCVFLDLWFLFVFFAVRGVVAKSQLWLFCRCRLPPPRLLPQSQARKPSSWPIEEVYLNLPSPPRMVNVWEMKSKSLAFSYEIPQLTWKLFWRFLTSHNQSTFFQSNRNSKLEEKPVLSTSTQTLFYHLEVVPVISGVNGGGQNGYLSSWA